jgi:YD repeat-containing protein
MNRALFFTAVSFFFVSAAFAQSKKQIKELKIKSTTETLVTYKDGKEVSNYKSEYSTYDKDGNTTTQIEYNPDGSVKRKETTKYAGKDKIEEVIEHPSGGSESDDQKKYKKTTWKYNSAGDKTEEVEYDAAGNVTKKTTYAYNSKGNRAFEMEYDGAGKLLKKTAYGYDSKGLRTEKKVYGPGDVLEKYVKYTYTY